jgi:hypothetical protein
MIQIGDEVGREREKQSCTRLREKQGEREGTQKKNRQT